MFEHDNRKVNKKLMHKEHLFTLEIYQQISTYNNQY